MLKSLAAFALLAAFIAGNADAAAPIPITTAQWIAAKNAWTRAATAHGVAADSITCRYPRLQTPYCDFGTAVGSVQLHDTSIRCQVEAWAVKPPGTPGFKVSKVTVNPCRAGWTRTLPLPWR